MRLTIARFFSLLFSALAMVPPLAHLLELPNKMQLSRDEYLTVQQIYRGWALLGVVVIAALISTLRVSPGVLQLPVPLAQLLVERP